MYMADYNPGEDIALDEFDKEDEEYEFDPDGYDDLDPSSAFDGYGENTQKTSFDKLPSVPDLKSEIRTQSSV